jgi:hypothetical protein
MLAKTAMTSMGCTAVARLYPVSPRSGGRDPHLATYWRRTTLKTLPISARARAPSRDETWANTAVAASTCASVGWRTLRLLPPHHHL